MINVSRVGEKAGIAVTALLVALFIGTSNASAAWNPFQPEVLSTAAEQFEYAQMMDNTGKHKAAMDSYQMVVDNFPSSPLAAEAQFRVAEMLEKTRHFHAAFNAYQAVLDNFPSYPKINLILERQFKIGNLFLQGKTIAFLKINPKSSYKRAIIIFRKILSNAPFSELAPKAQYNLGMAHMKRKEYIESTIEFEKVPLRYPHSERVAPAKYQLGVCAYKQAKAAPYDQEAAQEAINRLREYAKEYPGDKNAESAKEMLVDIQSRRADSLYKIGCFYKERGSPKASLIYFREVIRDYPLTRHAAKALKHARREERKLELVESVNQVQGNFDDIIRRIRGQKWAINKIKSKGRKRWQFWKYVFPRKLSAEEKSEIAERQRKISVFRNQLNLAELDLREKKELMQNRLRFLQTQADIEKIEDEIREANVELQVSQNKLLEIGDLPEAETNILEAAAIEIAEKEELVRRKESRLVENRIILNAIEEEVEAREQRIKEQYRGRREKLEAQIEGGELAEEPGSAKPGRSLLSGFVYRIAVAPSRVGRSLSSVMSGTARSTLSVFGGRREKSDEGAAEKREKLCKEAERLVDFGDEKIDEEKWNEAMENYDRAAIKLMELMKTFPGFNRDVVSRMLRRCSEGLRLARRESARQQYTELSAELEARLKKNPSDADAQLTLAELCQRYGEVDRAIDIYKKVLLLSPRNATVYYNLGVAYRSSGDMKAAAAAFRSAVAIDPADETAFHNLGVVYKELGDYERARTEFERALEINPSFAPSYFVLGHLYYSALGDRHSAASCWRKYLTLKPNDPQAARLREWIEQVERARDEGRETKDDGRKTGDEGLGTDTTEKYSWWMFWK